ncbi:placenta-specific protein 1 [Orycteropus afer afer]|uniref:Placenta-specific protein 1 n=1 Tax=Orycteropus afer afer TaxID=1230840 RepID=A0A8B7AM79_ORYAF|nr:placenta-specific protein 1 [Orycteropus afer afer]
MKAFELMGGMVLLISVIPSCAGQNPVTVLCSIDWFMVTVHPFMLNSDVYVHFSELHLGRGCPANHVQPHACQFTYRVIECGIKAKVISQNMVIYSTEMHYASKGTSSKYMIPVSCVAPQHSPWLTTSCPVCVTSRNGATTQDDETSCKMLELSQSSQRPVCDCSPSVFSEEEGTQAERHQTVAQEANLEQSPYFVDISEDWPLCSDDLIESM